MKDGKELKTDLNNKTALYYYDNSLLKNQSAKYKSDEVSYFPMALIDGAHYEVNFLQPISINSSKGYFTGESVFRSICSDAPPELCSDFTIIKKQQDHYHPDDWADHKLTYLFTAIILIALVFLVYFCYKRFIRRELTFDVNIKISEAINNYKEF